MRQGPIFVPRTARPSLAFVHFVHRTKRSLLSLFSPQRQLSSRILSHSAKVKRSRHFPLPPEIVLLIIESLPTTAALCFALTCRASYYNFFPQSLHLDSRDKRDFLIIIEKDVPGLYFCDVCIKLHPWKRKWSVTDWTTVHSENCMRLHNFSLMGDFYALSYHCARLVMNRHLYGDSHGIPLRNIETDMRDYDPGYNVALRASWRSRIVDDELFLRTTYEIWHLHGNTSKLRQWVDKSFLRICEHLFLGDHREDNWASRAREVSGMNGGFVECKAAVAKCRTCQTDYEISITWQGKEGWIIRIVVYRQFGKCRSPFDTEWVLMTRRGPPPNLLGQRDLAPGLRTARERWLQDKAT